MTFYLFPSFNSLLIFPSITNASFYFSLPTFLLHIKWSDFLVVPAWILSRANIPFPVFMILLILLVYKTINNVFTYMCQFKLRKVYINVIRGIEDVYISWVYMIILICLRLCDLVLWIYLMLQPSIFLILLQQRLETSNSNGRWWATPTENAGKKGVQQTTSCHQSTQEKMLCAGV